MECKIIGESSILKIQIYSIVVADHSILTGNGRISMNKEHFEGLLKAAREENQAVYSNEVETRDLKKHEDVI